MYLGLKTQKFGSTWKRLSPSRSLSFCCREENSLLYERSGIYDNERIVRIRNRRRLCY